MKEFHNRFWVFILLFGFSDCKKEISNSENLEPIYSDPNRQIQVRILWEKKNFL